MNLPYQDFKVQHFPAFEEECERKAARLSGKVLLRCLHLIWTHTRLTHSAGPESSPLEGNDLRPDPPSCLIPRGAGAGVGAMLGYQSVFLPSFPFSSFFYDSPASVGHFVIYGCQKARRRPRTVRDYMKRCPTAYFIRKIKHEAKWFLFLRAITLSGAPLHSLCGDDVARLQTKVFIALRRKKALHKLQTKILHHVIV